MNKDFYNLSVSQTAEKLQVDPEVGLSSEEVKNRRQNYGFNKLPEEKIPSIFYFFFKQFISPFVYLLLIAAVISALFREYTDTAVIIAALLINAAIGTYQEFKAEKILKDLQNLTSPQAKVRRDSKVEIIDAENLVPGDIAILEAGFKVPADGRVIQSYLIETNESLFTGESLPVGKYSDPIHYQAPIAERKNMVFMGTSITRGRGEIIVATTGPQTETGRLSTNIKETQKPLSPLLIQIALLNKATIWIVTSVCSLIFIIGIFQQDLKDAFITAVTLAVSVIPEGLPTLITVTLALGVHKMAREKALVQNLNTVETLGQVTHLVTDKTGTLTLNKFQAAAVIFPAGKKFITLEVKDLSPFQSGLKNLLKTIVFASDATSAKLETNFDDPLEVGILEFAEKFHESRSQALKRYPRIFELPFESEHRYMATFHRLDSKRIRIQIKGAPEVILSLCSQVNSGNQKNKLDRTLQNQFESLIDINLTSGEKVIAFGQKVVAKDELESLHWQHEKIRHYLKKNLELIGAIALSDPIRENSALAIKNLSQAGVKVIMATGDHPKVALNVASKLNIPPELALGQALEQKATKRLINQTTVYSRIEPKTKLKLVDLLQKNQAIVAMTGDGVNDAPALKKSDVGIAMGKSGSDLAREAADIVLLDDDISTITQAVRSGRNIIANLQKVISYLLATNLSELIVVLIGILIWGLAARPILPTQILWINLVTDGIAVLPLAIEPDHEDLMQNKPRPKKIGILSPNQWNSIILVSIIISSLSIFTFTFVFLNTHNLALARTMTFSVMVFSQIFNLLNNRSDRIPNISSKLRRNPLLLYSFLISLALQILILNLPTFREFLHLEPLYLSQILSLILFSSLVFWVVEFKKHFQLKT